MQDERWLINYNEVMDFMEGEHRKSSKYYPEEKLRFHIIHHYKKFITWRFISNYWRCVKCIG